MTQDLTKTKDPLLQPLQINHLTLKNRIISTSHAISYADNARPKERYQLYHEAKAKGGLALTMFGGASNIAQDSPSMFGQLDVSNDAIIPDFQEFADRIHAHGAALMCQITHMGGRTTSFGGNWLPTVAPSRMREEMSRSFSREMTQEDIERIIKAYGDAAWRCKEGGLDGCELLATGHLVDQFWSPRTNQRTDEFGGSMENRTRFSRMVLDEMRRRTGDNFIISLRMTMEENTKDGLTQDDCLEIAHRHRAEGNVDMLGLVHGRLDSFKGLAEYMPGMAAPIAPFLEMAGRFRREIDMPIFHATRVTDIATARHALRDGLVDMIGITRGHIADPNIVEKIRNGQENLIRPCVGATYCTTYRQCIHNAATGREASLPHVVTPTTCAQKKVVIIGGGPGGLEAARVSALRGHEVVLFEAADRLGGQVLLAAKASWRRDMIGIIDWLVAEVERLGVTQHLNTFADEEDVLSENPDVVIIATGGLPDEDHPVGNVQALSTWDVLGNPESVSGSALIFDSLGRAQAASCADQLATKGVQVEIITPDAMAGYEIGKIERPVFMQRLYEKGVKITTDHRLIGAEKSGNGIIAQFTNVLSDEIIERTADHLIIETGLVPNDDLFVGLKDGSVNKGVTEIASALAGKAQPAHEGRRGYQLYAVGDAVSCRDIHTAILDSMRICVAL